VSEVVTVRGATVGVWAPHGRVMVTDFDTRFLSDLAGLPGVKVRQADLKSDPPPPDAFDPIHARAVLEHLPGLPAAHQEHGPARTDATAAGRDLARYGLGPKDVDDTDD